jgi:hypothetical protein
VQRTNWLVAGAIGALALAAPGDAVTRMGTSGPDLIRGSRSADELYGRAGDDRLFGLSGHDLLDGGAGADLVVGGRGGDRLIGGSGADLLRARDARRDRVRCGEGEDSAVVDGLDVVRGCEVVHRPAAPPSPEPPPTPSPVALENQKPGTPGWASFGGAPPGAIEGYTRTSAAPGDSLRFHVSADPSESYRIRVFRMGWYGGIGARLVACLPGCEDSGTARPEPTPEKTEVGLVHAGWPVVQRLEIPRDWVSGYYLVQYLLTSGANAGDSTASFFVLREAPGNRRAPMLVQAGASTWQAYNGWGGGSLYEFNSPGGRRAAKVSFDRPMTSPGLTKALAWDVPLVRFLERRGYDVAYQADVDTARDPATLDGRDIVVVAGHNEYWTKGVRDAFDRAKASGIDLAFFGANAAYWQIRYEDDFRTIVGYKSASWDPETDPQLETDLFRSLVPPRYECALMGIQHQGGILDWATMGDYTVVATGDPWLGAAGLAPGDLVKGVVSREVDAIPGHQTAEDSCGNRLTVLFHREAGGDTLGNADGVRFTAPSGAKVFASGSHQFAWGLEDVPELREFVPEGMVDPRLQRFAEAMLGDMLGA